MALRTILVSPVVKSLRFFGRNVVRRQVLFFTTESTEGHGESKEAILRGAASGVKLWA
jgi:hypothetical protein